MSRPYIQRLQSEPRLRAILNSFAAQAACEVGARGERIPASAYRDMILTGEAAVRLTFEHLVDSDAELQAALIERDAWRQLAESYQRAAAPQLVIREIPRSEWQNPELTTEAYELAMVQRRGEWLLPDRAGWTLNKEEAGIYTERRADKAAETMLDGLRNAISVVLAPSEEERDLAAGDNPGADE